MKTEEWMFSSSRYKREWQRLIHVLYSLNSPLHRYRMLLFDGDSGVCNGRFNVVCNIRLWLCIGLSACSTCTWCSIQFNSILSGSERTILTRYQGRYRHKHRQKHYCVQQVRSQQRDTTEKSSRPRPKAKCRSDMHTLTQLCSCSCWLQDTHTHSHVHAHADSKTLIHSHTQSCSCSCWLQDTHTLTHTVMLMLMLTPRHTRSHTHSDADSKAHSYHTAGRKPLILTTIWATPPILN